MDSELLDLSPEQERLAREFVANFAELLTGRKIWEVGNLHFRPYPENDGGRYDEWGSSHHMSLCQNEAKAVVSWCAKPFIDPGTRYFETHEFTPVPSIWIEASVVGDTTYTAKFACATSDSGTPKQS